MVTPASSYKKYHGNVTKITRVPAFVILCLYIFHFKRAVFPAHQSLMVCVIGRKTESCVDSCSPAVWAQDLLTRSALAISYTCQTFALNCLSIPNSQSSFGCLCLSRVTQTNKKKVN